VETIEVGRLERRIVGLTAEEVSLTLAAGTNCSVNWNPWNPTLSNV
jgi:hypothetical protein